MKHILHVLLFSMLCFPMMGQVVNYLDEDFSPNPFSVGSAFTSLPVNTGSTSNGCNDPSYAVTSAFNNPCTGFPFFTGDGDFMAIDNDAQSFGLIYGRNLGFLAVGDYTFSLEGRHRFSTPNASTGQLPVPLEIRLNGNTVGTVTIALQNQAWQTYTATFTLNQPLANPTFEIVQPNAGLQADYGLDNLVLDLLIAPCNITNPNFSYTVTDNEYCFEAFADPNSDIVSYLYAWDFGDGTTVVADNPCHIYAPGSYEACVTIYAYGPSSEKVPCDSIVICKDICVFENGPSCSCDVGKLDLQVTQFGCNVIVDVTATPNECTQITGYRFNWGDGTIQNSNGPSQGHAYSNFGEYLFSVTVFGTDGKQACSSTIGGKAVCEKVPFKANPGEDPIDGKARLYPNPSQGQLNIQHLYSPNQELRLSVSSIDGKVIWKQNRQVRDAEFTVDLSTLSNGYYFLQIEDETGQREHYPFVLD